MSTELYTYFLEETLNHLKEINKLPEDINEFNITVIKDSKTHNILGMSYEDFIDNIESLDTKYIRGHSWDSDPEGWISFNDGSWTEREYGEHISQGSYWEYKTCPTNKKKVIQLRIKINMKEISKSLRWWIPECKSGIFDGYEDEIVENILSIPYNEWTNLENGTKNYLISLMICIAPKGYSLKDLVYANQIVGENNIVSDNYKDYFMHLNNALKLYNNYIRYGGKMIFSSEYIMYGKPLELSTRLDKGMVIYPHCINIYD